MIARIPVRVHAVLFTGAMYIAAIYSGIVRKGTGGSDTGEEKYAEIYREASSE